MPSCAPRIAPCWRAGTTHGGSSLLTPREQTRTTPHGSRPIRVNSVEEVIRNATREDFPAVLALWDGARSGHAETPDSIEALERLAPGALLVHEEQGVIVGALIAAF